MSELGKRGGAAKAKREAERKLTVASAMILATIDQRRAQLERAAGEVRASNVDETKKATALVAVIKCLGELDGFAEMPKRIAALEQELMLLRTTGGSGMVYSTSFSGPSSKPSVQ